MKKVLMILTSHATLDNSDDTTGVWLGEFTDPYYEFLDEGYAVTLASPAGGKPPIDPRSELTENISPSNRRFKDDANAKMAFENTVKLDEVEAEGYEALFFPGGHGPMWDLATSEKTADLVKAFYTSNRPIGALCHGPAALLKASETEPGILRGREVTGFSNTEEGLVGLADNIPFKLEDKLKELGGQYESALIPFTSKVLVSGNIVTGQNPASAGKTAREVIELMKQTVYPLD